MFAGFDYGPFIDPVLLDLCLKVSILSGVIFLIVIFLRHAKRTRDDLARVQPPEAVPAQIVELKRQVALNSADVEKYRSEIGQLRREAEERNDEFTGLLDKYVSLLHSVEELEGQVDRFPYVGKISVTTRAMHPVGRVTPEKPEDLREPTLPPPNPKSLTKAQGSSDSGIQTLKLPAIKKSIPRED